MTTTLSEPAETEHRRSAVVVRQFSIDDEDGGTCTDFESSGDLAVHLRLGGATSSTTIEGGAVAVMLDIDGADCDVVVVDSSGQLGRYTDAATIDRAIYALELVRHELHRLTS